MTAELWLGPARRSTRVAPPTARAAPVVPPAPLRPSASGSTVAGFGPAGRRRHGRRRDLPGQQEHSAPHPKLRATRSRSSPPSTAPPPASAFSRAVQRHQLSPRPRRSCAPCSSTSACRTATWASAGAPRASSARPGRRDVMLPAVRRLRRGFAWHRPLGRLGRLRRTGVDRGSSSRGAYRRWSPWFIRLTEQVMWSALRIASYQATIEY